MTEFIEASRKFVCIRIETYENKESEAMVRELLGGTFKNTAFVVFDPQGERKLSAAGRSPAMGLKTKGSGRRGRGGPPVKPGSGTPEDEESKNAELIRQMQKIASEFKPVGNSEATALQDFNTFRQALNVASADQRLLVFVNANQKSAAKVQDKLKSVFADPEIVGKFHLNFANQATDKGWAEVIKDSKNKQGLVVIRAGQFGIDGHAVEHLSLNDDAESIKKALLAANEIFSMIEKRKTYSSHVQEGRRQRVYFENEIPYGEDHDGDGTADGRGGRGRGR